LEFVKIYQNVPANDLPNISNEIQRQINSINIDPLTYKNKRIGITVGSRGIYSIDEIIRSVVNTLKEFGAYPIIIPAMGSHGGAKEEGQKEVLKSLGIEEEYIGAPIHYNVNAQFIGNTHKGFPVYVNSEAFKMDGIIVVNRIKSHTDFTGEIESGLCKMMTIGLGSHKGAATAHYYALENGYTEIICDSAKVIMEKLPIIFGIGIVENWKGHIMKVKAIHVKEIIEEEKKLLKLYIDNSVKLPFDNLEMLIIGEMGKNYSGSGMDTNVIGRTKISGQNEPVKPRIDQIVVLDISEASHGNATGIGLADFTTKKVFNKIDIEKTMINGITSMAPEQVRIPCVAASDKEAIKVALRMLGPTKSKDPQIAYIENTSQLQELYVSTNMMNKLKGNIEIISSPLTIQYNENGSMAGFIKNEVR